MLSRMHPLPFLLLLPCTCLLVNKINLLPYHLPVS